MAELVCPEIVMVLLLVLAVITFPVGSDSEIRCDTSSERLAALVHEATDLREDSVWVRNRKEWGWNGREQISRVVDRRLCEKAAAALVHDGYVDARTKVALVRVGKGYVAQPGDDWDLWIVLDPEFRVLARIIVPS